MLGINWKSESLNKTAISIAVTIGILFLIPWLQFGVIYSRVYEGAFGKEIDRSTCRCECWDVKFKGYYEQWPGRYHSVYFNITTETAAIWLITLAYVLLIYESVKKLILAFCAGQSRFLYFALFLLGLYSHHYTWWAFFGYFNDAYYDQLFHQTLFSLSEIYASWIVILKATKPSLDVTFHLIPNKASFSLLENELSQSFMLLSISLAHMVVGGLDQFIQQNIFGRGHVSQKTRNIGFILPDIGGMLLSLAEIYRLLHAYLRTENPQRSRIIFSENSTFLEKLKNTAGAVSKIIFRSLFVFALIFFPSIIIS